MNLFKKIKQKLELNEIEYMIDNHIKLKDEEYSLLIRDYKVDEEVIDVERGSKLMKSYVEVNGRYFMIDYEVGTLGTSYNMITEMKLVKEEKTHWAIKLGGKHGRR